MPFVTISQLFPGPGWFCQQYYQSRGAAATGLPSPVRGRRLRGITGVTVRRHFSGQGRRGRRSAEVGGGGDKECRSGGDSGCRAAPVQGGGRSADADTRRSI